MSKISSTETSFINGRTSKLHLTINGGLKHNSEQLRMHQRQGKACAYSITGTSSGEMGSIGTKDMLENVTNSLSLSSLASIMWELSSGGFVLDAREDKYGGVIVNLERLPWNVSTFAAAWRTSLAHWEEKVVGAFVSSVSNLLKL